MALHNSTIWWCNYSSVRRLCRVLLSILGCSSFDFPFYLHWKAGRHTNKGIVYECSEKCVANMNLLKATFPLQAPQFKIKPSV